LFSLLLKKLLNRSWSERVLFLEALVLLGLARLSVLVVPFRYLAALLGVHMLVSPKEATPKQVDRSRRVGKAVRLVARHTPWYSNCLAQAIAAKMMLRLRGIDSTLFLGVANDREFDGRKELYAHAWLRSGDLIVTGGGNLGRFKVLSTFSGKNRVSYPQK
jgi:hypothetical protein